MNKMIYCQDCQCEWDYKYMILFCKSCHDNRIDLMIKGKNAEISYLNKRIRELEKENHKLRFKKGGFER